MRVKYIKSIGGIEKGEIREVGRKTADTLIEYKVAEPVRAAPKRNKETANARQSD